MLLRLFVLYIFAVGVVALAQEPRSTEDKPPTLNIGFQRDLWRKTAVMLSAQAEALRAKQEYDQMVQMWDRICGEKYERGPDPEKQACVAKTTPAPR